MKRILFLALLLTACRGTGRDLLLSGTLEYTEHSVGSRVAGRIAEIPIEEGQHVAKGQRIAILDRYDQAKRDYSRANALMSQGGTAEQALEQARLSLEDQEILSPVDGVVMVKVHEAGEVVAGGSPVAIIGQDASPWVRVYVPEGYVNRVQIGSEVELHFDGVKEAYQGKVLTVAAEAEFTPRNVQTPDERATQTFAIKIGLTQSAPALRPGVAADVRLPLAAK